MKLRRSALALIVLSSLQVPAAGQEDTDPAFRVIVHPDNPIASDTAASISKLFLKKIARWEDGTLVQPVDLGRRSATREAFSQTVHGRDLRGVLGFWQRQIFSGRGVPPPELRSGEDVVDFVRQNPGAIGYVSRDTVLDGVKVIEVR